MPAKRLTDSEAHRKSVGYGDISGDIDAFNLPTLVFTQARSMGKRQGDALIGACVRYAFAGEEPEGLSKTAARAFEGLRGTLDRRRVGKMTGGDKDSRTVSVGNQASNQLKFGRISKDEYQVDGQISSDTVGRGVWGMGIGVYEREIPSSSIDYRRASNATAEGFRADAVEEIARESALAAARRRSSEGLAYGPNGEAPTLESVEAYAMGHQIALEDARSWYENEEENGWTDDSGRRIRNPGMALAYWARTCEENRRGEHSAGFRVSEYTEYR